MADLIPQTFKAEQGFINYMVDEASFHDLSRSEFIRQCVRIAAPILRVCPDMLSFDDKRVSSHAKKVGEILVILERD